MDRISAALRRKLMKSVRSKGSDAERAIRKVTRKMGFRYRLHARNLPGTPDLVFSAARAVIFVNGCFWHQHKGCPRARRPATRKDYWAPKLDANIARDKRAIRDLRKAGWRVLTLWECEILRKDSDPEKLVAKIAGFLADRN